MTDYAEVPAHIVEALRPAALALPEAYEEQAWAGTRWRIRTRTFVHVITVDEGNPPAFARAADTDPDEGLVTVITFRSLGAELEALSLSGHPFFKPPWVPTVIGMILDADTDWDDVAELITESYCILAPKKLAALVERPEPERPED